MDALRLLLDIFIRKANVHALPGIKSCAYSKLYSMGQGETK
jgi:hypothetical protein